MWAPGAVHAIMPRRPARGRAVLVRLSPHRSVYGKGWWPMDRRGSLLLVEDEDVLRMLVAQFLRAEGFSVCEAADGAEGVAKYAEEGPFDLLLVDLNLPCLPGVEVCRRVRKQSPGQKI